MKKTYLLTLALLSSSVLVTATPKSQPNAFHSLASSGDLWAQKHQGHTQPQVSLPPKSEMQAPQNDDTQATDEANKNTAPSFSAHPRTVGEAAGLPTPPAHQGKASKRLLPKSK